MLRIEQVPVLFFSCCSCWIKIYPAEWHIILLFSIFFSSLLVMFILVIIATMVGNRFNMLPVGALIQLELITWAVELDQFISLSCFKCPVLIFIQIWSDLGISNWYLRAGISFHRHNEFIALTVCKSIEFDKNLSSFHNHFYAILPRLSANSDTF